MADSPLDKPQYKTVRGRVAGALGRTPEGKSAMGIFAKEAISRTTLGINDLESAFVIGGLLVGVLGNVAVCGVAGITSAVLDPDSVQVDPTLSTNFSQSAGYIVSQELESRIALIQHNGSYEVYRVQTTPPNYRLDKDGDHDTVHRWDLIENPVLAQIYAAEVADTYAKTLAMMEQHPNIPAAEFAPATFSYGGISMPYLEQDGEIYRDSRRGTINRLTGDAIAPTLAAQQTLWQQAAAAITPENYGAGRGEVYQVVEVDNFGHRMFETYKDIWTYGALGWLGLSLAGAGLATAGQVSGRRPKKSRSSRYDRD